MRNLKKILSVMICAALALSLPAVPCFAEAATEETVAGESGEALSEDELKEAVLAYLATCIMGTALEGQDPEEMGEEAFMEAFEGQLAVLREMSDEDLQELISKLDEEEAAGLLEVIFAGLGSEALGELAASEEASTEEAASEEADESLSEDDLKEAVLAYLATCILSTALEGQDPEEMGEEAFMEAFEGQLAVLREMSDEDLQELISSLDEEEAAGLLDVIFAGLDSKGIQELFTALSNDDAA